MTKQTAYNKIRKYFTQPDAELAKTAFECRYRMETGAIHKKVRKCAIGCLIPDKLYGPEMENKSAEALLEQFSDLALYFGISDPYEEEARFLTQAQKAHDSSATVKGFLRKLDALARKNGLKVAA